MRPEEMIYAAMKVNEWTEKVEQKKMRERTSGRKAERLEKKKRMEERNEALRSMLNRV